jgi:outer membrane murein-binding lipoprotein Lpp
MLVLSVILASILSAVPNGFAATDEEIQALRVQVQELMQRIEKLEAEQTRSTAEVTKAKEEVAKIKEASSAAGASKVDLSNALSKLKMKGRLVTGYLDSGKAGSYQSGSFEVPDAKLQFSFQPDDINTIVMRFNLNNAALQTPNFDYLYLQSKDFLPGLKNTPFSLSSRLGRFKLGFGEETLSDNAVEGVLPSNSVAKTGATDEGLELAGKIDLAKMGLEKLKPLGWVLSVSDGNSIVGSDSSRAKAFMGKLYYTPIEPLYLSASYYDSGALKTSSAEMSIASLVAVPTGATNWERHIWELNARYDFGKGKKPLDPPAFSDSKAIVRFSYGAFSDITSSSTAPERTGNFGFAEGTYNLTKKIYVAGRYSIVNLDGDATATLNTIANTNRYDRYSLGLGYRWSENTILKLGYDINKEAGPNIDDANNNLLSAVVTTQF